MKICYIAHSAIPSRAANSVHVMKMCQAMAKNGEQVVLLAPGHKVKDADNGGDVFDYYGVDPCFGFISMPYIPAPRLGAISSMLWMFAYLLRTSCDLVFTRDIPAAYIASLLGRNVLLERHDAFESVATRRLFMFRRLIKRANFRGLVVVTQATKDEILKTFDIAPEKIIVAADGADVIAAHKTPVDAADRKMRIGYTGHLYEGRGIDLIGAVAAMLPDHEFHIVGGRDEDIRHWKNILGGQPNLIFHGFVAPSEVPEYLLSFDILLAPYQTQVGVSGGGDTARWMSPLKIFEYMAAGKPIICSDLPVLREVMKDGHNCFLCNPTAPEDWVQKIKALDKDKALAEEMGSNALTDLLSKYTWNVRARSVLNATGLDSRA